MVRAAADVVLDEVDDRLRRRARREDLGDAELLELRDVLVGDRPADHDDDVAGVLLVEQLDHLRHERHVRAGEDRQADRVRVLLQRGLHDLLGRLVQAGVDDLHAGVAQRARDDLRAAVVAVEAGLGDDDADLPSSRPCGEGYGLTRAVTHRRLSATLGSLLGCSLAAILLAGGGVGVAGRRDHASRTTPSCCIAPMPRSSAPRATMARARRRPRAPDRRLVRARAVGAPRRSKPARLRRRPTRAPIRRPASTRSTAPSARSSSEGMKVQIDLAFWAPRWAREQAVDATRCGTGYAPDPKEFGAFARAIARRYSGRFTDRRNGVYGRLPAVRHVHDLERAELPLLPRAAVEEEAPRRLPAVLAAPLPADARGRLLGDQGRQPAPTTC